MVPKLELRYYIVRFIVPYMQSEVSMLMLQADPRSKSTIVNLYKKAKRNVTETSRINAKWLTEIYTTNTSLVAILIATITFAAAFTLPGGYNSNSGSEGLPIMSRKFAFQAFLVSDTLAMFIITCCCLHMHLGKMGGSWILALL